MTWGNKEVEFLRLLWSTEKSASCIAREMGKTKGAVIGKANREGLPARPSPIIRNPSLYKKSAFPVSNPIKRLSFKRIYKICKTGQCQWIENNPTGEDNCKCLKPVVYDKGGHRTSWCAKHYPVVWRPVPRRKR